MCRRNLHLFASANRTTARMRPLRSTSAQPLQAGGRRFDPVTAHRLGSGLAASIVRSRCPPATPVQPRRAPAARKQRRASVQAGTGAASGAAAERHHPCGQPSPQSRKRGRWPRAMRLMNVCRRSWNVMPLSCSLPSSSLTNSAKPALTAAGRKYRPALRASGPETLARAMRHRRWRAVHARRSRPGVTDRREPGSAKKKREPKRVHRLIVPATWELRQRSAPPFPDSLHMYPDSAPGWVDDGQTRRATPRGW